LPPRAIELNLVENVGQYSRPNRLSNGAVAIREGWRKRAAHPEAVAPIDARRRASVGWEKEKFRSAATGTTYSRADGDVLGYFIILFGGARRNRTDDLFNAIEALIGFQVPSWCLNSSHITIV
jgi:hypothetical protein